MSAELIDLDFCRKLRAAAVECDRLRELQRFALWRDDAELAAEADRQLIELQSRSTELVQRDWAWSGAA
jgi:hypothetical protein